MATTPQQNFAHDSDRTTAPIDPNTVINQGDLVKISSNLATPITASADQVFGVAADSNPVASLGDKLSSIGVIRRGVVRLFLKASDSVAYDGKVWFVTDAQHVTSVDPTSSKAVGRCRELSAVTGAADGSTRILVEVNFDVVS